MIEFYDLTARHQATLLWLLTGFALASGTKSGIRATLWQIAKTLLHPALLLWFVGLLLTVAIATVVVVWLGRIVGLWQVPPIVSASSWFLFSGVGLLMNFGKALEGEGVLTRSTGIVSPVMIVTAVMSVSTLPLLAEVLIFPVVFLLSILVAFVSVKEPNGHAHTILVTSLSVYVVLSLALAIYRLIDDLSVGQSIAQSLLLPMWLTLPTLLYIRFLVTLERTKFLWNADKKRTKASDYGDEWPLTVESALLCAKNNAVWIVVNGKRFRLNGTADGVFRGLGVELSDIREIQRVDDKLMERYGEWLDLEEGGPPLVSVHPLIRDGLALDTTSQE